MSIADAKQRIIDFINTRNIFDSAPADLVKPDGSDWLITIPPEVYYNVAHKLQVIDIVCKREFLVANVVKYVLRAGKKTPNPIPDLMKARDNINLLIHILSTNDK